jgi:hypothetical protein
VKPSKRVRATHANDIGEAVANLVAVMVGESEVGEGPYIYYRYFVPVFNGCVGDKFVRLFPSHQFVIINIFA